MPRGRSLSRDPSPERRHSVSTVGDRHRHRCCSRRHRSLSPFSIIVSRRRSSLSPTYWRRRTSAEKLKEAEAEKMRRDELLALAEENRRALKEFRIVGEGPTVAKIDIMKSKTEGLNKFVDDPEAKPEKDKEDNLIDAVMKGQTKEERYEEMHEMIVEHLGEHEALIREVRNLVLQEKELQRKLQITGRQITEALARKLKLEERGWNMWLLLNPEII